MWERKEGRDWPANEREAREIEEGLETEFKIQCVSLPPLPLSPLLVRLLI